MQIIYLTESATLKTEIRVDDLK